MSPLCRGNPLSIASPVYNGTKAWLHLWSMNLRTQLKQAGYEGIRVVEVAPPTVATGLHRDGSDLDDKKEKNSVAMSVEEYVEETVKQWKEGKETFGAGPSSKGSGELV
ncbi:hypothetical protein EJ03DRAFT_370488 [Teratosphaeria nubilosa]|uniref:NAD(P)-binding protein n=1 Tax=Teratosphaeria nubilosa TaxID=161662 RepID=A0A6G1LP37_9PEZI|nr:hypothetical protein EJ03DRAFT_370488 [Teratosphaeria nubilosa]